MNRFSKDVDTVDKQLLSLMSVFILMLSFVVSLIVTMIFTMDKEIIVLLAIQLAIVVYYYIKF
jgi:hypothetical protein